MRALVLEHTELNRATVFIDVLRARGVETVVIELDRGDELADWRHFDIVVAMGGPQSAFEEVAYPWLVEEKRLIREVIDAGRPYFGVCLGSQLLAASLGGRVYRGLEPEVGLHPVVLTEDAARDPVFAGFPREISVLEFHQDHFELPPGAVRLAGSSRYPNQAYRVGRLAYAVQCHLEASLEDVEQCLNLAPGLASIFERRHGEGALARLLDDYAATVPFLQASAQQLFRRFLENALASGGIRGPVALPAASGRWRGILVGREHECRRIEASLAAARGGCATVLVLAGEEGSGRTALIDHAVAHARSMRVVRTTGTPPRALLPFGCLSEVVAPLLVDAARETTDVRAILHAACSRSDEPAGVDRLAVCGALVELVADTAERSPLLIAIDDLSLVDEPSAEAFGFLARRLGAERVIILAAASPFENRFPGVERLHLSRLEDAAARALVAAVAPGLPRSLTEAIVSAARGVPFALREMAADTAEADAPPPDTPSAAAEWLILRRIARLGAEDRRALLRVALDGENRTPIPNGAIAVRLALDVDGKRRLLHPLVAPTVVYAATEKERRDAHGTLAADARDPDLRAWHLAAAAAGADAEAAAALDAAAERAARRTAWQVAANAWELAARLSADPAARARRLVSAARGAAAAGHTLAALDHFDAALEGALTSDERAAAEHSRGRLAARTGRAREAADRLVGAVGFDTDPERAAAMLADAVTPMLRAGDPGSAIAIARRARAAAPPGSAAEAAAVVALTTALALGGHIEEARRTAHGLATDTASASSGEDLELRAYAGAALRLLGRDDDARRVLEAVVGEARRRGLPGLLPYALVRLGGVELEEGHWQKARTALEEALGLAREAGRAADTGLALGALAWLAAARGDAARLESALAEARDVAQSIGAGSQLDYAATAAAIAALARADGTAAEEDLRPVLEAQARLGFPDAATRPHVTPELVEALALRGSFGEAQRLAEAFANEAERLGVTSAAAAALRCRVLTCADADLEAALAAAHFAGQAPFERARTLLAAAGRLCGSAPDRAACVLDEAARLFARLGAQPWLARTIELAASARVELPRYAQDPLDRLAPDELAVVLAAREGASTQEIAARLVIGPRTVEAMIDEAERSIGADAVDGFAAVSGRAPGRDR